MSFAIFKCHKCGCEVSTLNGKEVRVICPDCNDGEPVVIEFNRMSNFLDLLRSGEEIDCDLIIGGCGMPASFVWDEDCRITDYVIEKYKSIMDAEYTRLENGNIEIHCEDAELGEDFCWAAAGYIGEKEFNRIFGEEKNKMNKVHLSPEFHRQMEQIRSIQQIIFNKDTMGELPPLTRLLFIGLWCIAGREGRLEDKPRKIKKMIMGYDDVTASQVDEMLQKLHDNRFIVRYHADGNSYIQIMNFNKYRNPLSCKKSSQIPPPKFQ
ncbi:MAG: hypothetical protein QME73_07830 [Bacillota bacterium]|nr:hypothetical protein [Bacillota bacterium]